MARYNDLNEETLTWGLLAKEWARVQWGSGYERRAAAQEGGAQTASFFVLSNSRTRDLRFGDRIVFAGIWDITEIAPHRAEIRVIATRAVNHGAEVEAL